MPISNTRIEDLTGTTFQLISQPIEFRFRNNPELSEADLTMEFIQMLAVDGAARNVNFGSRGKLYRTFADISALKPAYPGLVDPTSGADLTDVTVGGIVKLLLDLFDRAYEQDNTV